MDWTKIGLNPKIEGRYYEKSYKQELQTICFEKVSLRKRKLDMEQAINDLLVKIIRDSWFGLLSCTTEQLTEQQFVIVRIIGSGVGDGLLYIDGELINIAPSIVMNDFDRKQAEEQLYYNFPTDLVEFRRKYPGARIVALFN
jgi:hypothetical protein